MNSLLFGFLAFLYAYGGSVVFSLFESFFVEKEDGELFIRIMVFEISWSRGEFYVDLLPFNFASRSSYQQRSNILSHRKEIAIDQRRTPITQKLSMGNLSELQE
ncbi:hypothetical protein Q7M76_03575 [Candidatus Liberibacter asiaticus]|uniref:Uncharacterized protein n=1 Tax=Liberibacter asiaticus (strain psy62) TaxID=537021 RepID=C6XG08_LIBAP|nr:hypothetical protein [Candidatus Liberibacter asiaticus]ACT57311.1 hypothetical protein CLIBASIA_03665 [Candidatus Liberibacter asiaticus str. psy62]MBA2917609.1 hypothetical protein [Candidatus Liberibacter asiaticus]MBE2996728.1 hypothetical protein [Candidatus Liberibacter asiaticus]MCU7488681.1 hypothetical protein [Candidatus Liberibacter asiaticus]MCU7489716.1 hypothetical protein [Candidatus Liberibacter asiaticus]